MESSNTDTTICNTKSSGNGPGPVARSERQSPAAPDTTDIETAVLYRALAGLARRAVGAASLRGALLGWFDDNREFCADGELTDAFAALQDIAGRRKGRRPATAGHRIDETARTLADLLEQRLRRYGAVLANRTVSRNLAYLAAELGLDRVDVAILETAIDYDKINVFEDLFDEINRKSKNVHKTLEICLGLDRSEIQRHLKPKSPLIASGILQISKDGRFCAQPFEIHSRIEASVDVPFDSHAEFVDAILGAPVAATLRKADFEYFATGRDLVSRLIKGACAQGAAGVNVLIYGPTGCGKTELCKTVSKMAGLQLYAIGEKDDDGDEPNRSERLMALRYSQRLLSHRAGSAILFDELEDLLPTPVFGLFGVHQGSKVYLNRLLEENPVPVLWTSNDISCCDPAFLRRMTLMIEMRSPPPAARRNIWKRILKQQECALPRREIEKLAATSNPSPAVIANAARVARLSHGGSGAFTRALKGTMRVIQDRGDAVPGLDICEGFDLSLINADQDLAGLVEALRGCEHRAGASFCFSGPPGTGKSQFARYLARKLGLPVSEKKASDLLDKYVGESEKLIAGAFESAEADQTMLIIDEVEMFLSSRADVSQPWQLSQTNEFLTWMERHRLPWCATTNLVERVDAAALRRFTFKIRFDYLTSDQAGAAFKAFFNRPAPPGIRRAGQLTPADFALVKRQAGILGVLDDTPRLSEMLVAEAEHKQDRTIGFVV